MIRRNRSLTIPSSPLGTRSPPLDFGFRRAMENLESRWLDSKHAFCDLEFPMFNRSSTKKWRLEAVAAAVDSRGQSWKRYSIEGNGDASCSNCSDFAVVNNLINAFPLPFKSVKKRDSCQRDDLVVSASKGEETLPLVFFSCDASDNLVRGLRVFNPGYRKSESDQPPCPNSAPSKFDLAKIITQIIIGKKADFDGFLSNMGFARIGGAPTHLVASASAPEECMPREIARVLLRVPLSNLECLRSTLSTVSLTELIEMVPQLGKTSREHPHKEKLSSVQNFFRYTESEGRRFFEELDRDGDGRVTLEDLETAMRKKRLPKRYARELFRRSRRHIFSKSIGWKQFLSLMEQELTILRAYTTLCLSKSGTLQKNQIVTSLGNAGLPANADNAIAMMRYLNADYEGSISYSHFRNFMLLLPSKRLEDDPRNIWFEAATVAVSPPVKIGAESVLKSALAGGLACAFSTSVMHPVDTIKTQVQASTLSFLELMLKLPQIGLQGLYKGSIPAILGQFSSHGLRTGICEASKLILINVAPTLSEIQVQSMASFCGTILGTTARIPCEVLKQRLQAGIFENVGEAIVGILREDGIKGFFRGTGATLCREVPFYVAGMALYEEAKKGVHKLIGRDLKPWETIAVGALSGGFTGVLTTPLDVMKTRMMTAPQGMAVSMPMVVFTILSQDGPLGLFKGAVPRFLWIAPLGAMNFAGYELLRKAMDRTDPIP